MSKSSPGSVESKPPVCSISLLALTAALIFAVPVFPQPLHRLLYSILFTLIMLTATLSMDRGRRLIGVFAVASIALQWVATAWGLPVLGLLSRTAVFAFFIVIVFGLIAQTARKKRVTARVILESISGYLLLGIVFSLIVTIVATAQPEAFNFVDARDSGSLGKFQGDFIYYGFVTYTTLGYGDLLPIAPHAKSLAVLAAVCGQIYLTVIIAMLVGKFLNHSQD